MTVVSVRSTGGKRTAKKWFVGLVAGALVAGGLAFGGSGGAPALADTQPENPNDPSTPVTVSDDALPAPQINGVAWSQAMVGNKVYVGGSFSNARPAGSAPGQNTVPRGNVLAFDITTGQLDTAFAPSFNAQVRAIAVSPDKSRIYIGGEFTTVNGQSRRRIAAFDASTGALITSFAPPVNYDVDAVVATNTKVYVGGSFLGVGNQDRQFLAAFNASNGALLDWAPQATGGTVSAIAINPEGTKLAVGGSFTALNGSNNPGYGLGMVDAVTGESLPFAINSVVRNGTTDGAITSLTTDGTYIYGGGYTFGKSGGTWEGTFAASWDGGQIHFLNDCHGDTYDVQAIGDVVYSVGHSHYCENIDGPRQGPGGVGDYPYFRATATSRAATGTVTWEPDQGRYYSFLGQPAPSYLGWYPDINAGSYTGQYQGPWSITGNSDYIVAAGEFTRVNNTSQQGIVRFAVKDKAPNNSGPKLFNSTYPLNVTSTEAGSVRVNWMGNNDDDNEYLTYRVYRDTQNAAGLKHTATKRVRPWETITMGFTDTGLPPGTTHQYRVQVSDPFGNVANSPWTSVTVAQSGTDSAYVKAVYDDQPTNYWRLGESSGSTSADRVGFLPMTKAAGVAGGAAGAIAGDADQASTFNGASTGWAAVGQQENPPDVFTLELWFKTTTSSGGRMAGWSQRNTATQSTKHDRQLYMDNSGRVHFGTKPTSERLVVTSPTTYRDGAWHHAVGTLAKDGMKLYIDGAMVASRGDVTTGEHLALGYWRLGGDRVTGWPSAPSSGSFNGSLDEVAVYKTALSASAVARHYAAGTGAEQPNIEPVADFTAEADGLNVAFDGSLSTDPDGTIASYEWTFGDGGTANGVKPDHTFTSAGTYSVTLKVTDDDGASKSLTKQIKVIKPPVADFSFSADGVQLEVDGSGSSDDGSVVAYAWTFGDGAAGTGATASHEYEAGGTYDVSLTVTDDEGATDTVTKSVTIEAANVAPVADFSIASSGLSVDVDGSASDDADGSIASYAWEFGDDGTATGVSASHDYADAGTFDVTLTVTDDDGATHSVTKSVTVTEGAGAELARDQFERNVSSGWGSAEAGGAWTAANTASNYSVANGEGAIRMTAPGSARAMTLKNVSSADTEARVTMGVDKPATGGGVYLTLQPRVRPNGDEYFVDARLLSGGSVSLKLGRNVGSTETALQTATVAGLTLTPDDRLRVKAQSVGTSPTTFRAKVWKVGQDEPTAWTVSVTDSTASLQGPGAVGLASYLSGSATNAPVLGTFDDLWAGSTDDAPPPQNGNPVADFSFSADGVGLEVDGSGSSDDGSIASYAWNFGDGAVATGVTASHEYGAGGTYDVSLTVTDDEGATDTVTKSVSIEAANVAPVADFSIEPSGLSVDVDGSASDDPDGSIASYAWEFGDDGTATGISASHDYADGGTFDVTLTVTDDDGATHSVTKSVTVTDDAGAELARDQFERNVTDGWGSAEVGGAWATANPASNFSIADGLGRMRMSAPGSARQMTLGGVSSSDTEAHTTIGVDKAATGGGIYLTLQPRVRPNGDQYFVDTRLLSGGAVSVKLGRIVGATETALQSATVSGLTVTPDDRLRVKAQAVGTSPTTFRAKVWKVGQEEPAGWTLSLTDSTSALQSPGAVGLASYLSGSATNAPVFAIFDDFWAGPTP